MSNPADISRRPAETTDPPTVDANRQAEGLPAGESGGAVVSEEISQAEPIEAKPEHAEHQSAEPAATESQPQPTAEDETAAKSERAAKGETAVPAGESGAGAVVSEETSQAEPIEAQPAEPAATESQPQPTEPLPTELAPNEPRPTAQGEGEPSAEYARPADPVAVESEPAAGGEPSPPPEQEPQAATRTEPGPAGPGTAAAPSPAVTRPAIPSPADLARVPHRRPPTPAAAVVTPVAATPVEDSELARASRTFGRVDDEGRVFVVDGGTERELGSCQAGDVTTGLDFYVQRHIASCAELDLVEQRLRSRKLAPGEALASLTRHEQQVEAAPGVGDLPALRARTTALRELADEIRAQRAAEKAVATEQARTAKEAVVAEAEKLGGSNDWRGGVARFRTLLAQWKELPRLDRASDDALWHRFSAARTSYTRRRKVHFGELTGKRDEAKGAKESLLTEAEGLADSTDWAETGKRMRTLMDQWKAAGGAARDVDEQLWQRFRTVQDTFFAARTAHFAEQDAEFAVNAKAKESLLVEAEALLPVRDVGQAKATLRAIQDRWNDVGKVPRESMRGLEQRMRAVEQAVGNAESERWQRSNPEMRARAESTVQMLRESVSALERQLTAAQAAADNRKVAAAEESLAARRSWLVEAERALADYSD